MGPPPVTQGPRTVLIGPGDNPPAISKPLPAAIKARCWPPLKWLFNAASNGPLGWPTAKQLDSLPGRESLAVHSLAEPFASATTWLMWRKGMVGANLNAWIEQQQAVYPPPVVAAQAIA